MRKKVLTLYQLNMLTRKRQLEEAAMLPPADITLLQPPRIFTLRPAKSDDDTENLQLRQILMREIAIAINSTKLCRNLLSSLFIKRAIKNPKTFVFVASRAENVNSVDDVLDDSEYRLDGFAVARIVEPNDLGNREKTMLLSYLCGSGGGVGSALLTQVERQAKRSKATRVVIESLEESTAFYEKMGYTLCSDRDPDDLYYCKNVI
jgi:hypothetical protein